MKKIKFIIPTIFFLLIIFSSPVYAASGKIHSLSLSTLSVTKNSQETFYWLMCNNKLSGYSNSTKDQHAYYSEAMTTAQFERLLDNAFGNSTDNDLNFFYFTGHTIFESVDPISGPLGICINNKTTDNYSFRLLAQKLNSYKGKMVVILDTCGSEAFITDGINSLGNSSRMSAICSCGYLEESEFGYGYLNPYLFFNGYRYNAFTFALGKGLGFFDSNKKLLADSNSNGSVSVQELFQYAKKNTNSLKEMNVRMFSGNALVNIFSYGKKGVSISISETSVSIYKGKSKQLRAIVTGTSKKPSWSSSNNMVASVNSNGKVTAKKQGTAKITAAVGGKKAVCTVTVKAKAKRYSDIEKVANLTAAKAASALGLKVKISNVYSVFYTKNGKTGDGSSYMWCSQADTNERGMWTFYANDNSISVYGTRIGMSKSSVHNILSQKGWKKTSDITNNYMLTNTLGYDKGEYHIVVTIKRNKVTGISYYSVEHSW